jgi:hypothetical protein
MSKYSPLKVSLGISTATKGSISKGQLATTKTVTLQATHGNNLAGFEDLTLNDKYGPDEDSAQVYDQVKQMYLRWGNTRFNKSKQGIFFLALQRNSISSCY